MIKLVLFLLLFIGQNCFAYFDFGVGYSFSTKNSLEQSTNMRGLVGAQMSYDWYDLNLGLEINYFEESETELGLAFVSREYLDLVPWARYNFINTDRVDVFFGVGSGAYQEKIKINVSGAGKYEDRSKPHWLLSGAMGLKAKFGIISGVIEYRIARRMAEEQQDQSLRLSTNLSF